MHNDIPHGRTWEVGLQRTFHRYTVADGLMDPCTQARKLSLQFRSKEAIEKKYFLNLFTFPCIQVWSKGSISLTILSKNWWPPMLRKTLTTRALLVMFTSDSELWWPEKKAKATGEAHIWLKNIQGIFLIHSQGQSIQISKCSIYCQMFERG